MKIGELARLGQCTIETVRYYEKAGLLPPPGRTGSNYRHYGDAHVARLRFIRNCRALDMTHDERNNFVEHTLYEVIRKPSPTRANNCMPENLLTPILR